MCGVVLAVPGVHRERLVEGPLAPVLGVQVASLPLGRAEASQEQHPAAVQRLQEGQRELDRGGPRVGQLGPEMLEVRADGGCRLR